MILYSKHHRVRFKWNGRWHYRKLWVSEDGRLCVRCGVEFPYADRRSFVALFSDDGEAIFDELQEESDIYGGWVSLVD